MRPVRFLTIGAVTVAAACASGGSSPPAMGASPAVATAAADSAAQGTTRRRGDVISREEIAAAQGRAQNALEVIQGLRPQMLRPRVGTTSSMSGGAGSDASGMVSLVVYLENQRMGDVQQLVNVTIDQLREIRYISPADATTLWGTGHAGGVIQVFLRR